MKCMNFYLLLYYELQNESSIYSNSGVYFLLFTWPNASVNTNVNEFDSMIRGQHINKSVQTPPTDKMHKCIPWEDNKCDKYAAND